jgi:septum formation protein
VTRLILASRSPRRQQLLRAAGIRFRVIVPDVQEPAPMRRRHADSVRAAALAKAVAASERARGLILAADTIVVCGGEVIGKPGTVDGARRALRRLSGGWHFVYTGVALLEGERRLVGYERTEVAFRALSNQEIERYVATGEPMDKAGSYAIQGEGAALIRAIRGCYTNVIGLPLPMVLRMLAEFQNGGEAGARPRRSGRR